MPKTSEASTLFGLSPRWLWIGGILLGLVLALTVARGLLRPFLDSTDPVGAELSSEGGSKDAGLLIKGWADRSRARVGEPLKVWLKFSNPAAQDSTVEGLALYAPGFASTGPDSRSFRLLGERVPPVAVSAARFVVPHGRSLDRWVEVRPVERKGTFLVTVRVTWTTPSGRYQEALELGPIRAASPWLEGTAQVVDSLFSLFGTLAIPLAVALIGWLFQQRQQKFAQEKQAWNTMLPVSHTNNVQFYLPLLNGISAFENRAGKYQPNKGQSTEEICFYLLFCLKRIAEIDLTGSGYYLMDREGERLVAACQNCFLEQVRTHLPADDLRLVRDLLKPKETYAGYQKKLVKLAEFQAAVRRIEVSFGKKSEKDLKFLKSGLVVLSLLLEFELNRIYNFWYGDGPGFRYEKCKTQLEELPEGSSELAADVTSYMEKLRNRKVPALPEPRGLVEGSELVDRGSHDVILP